MRRLVFTLAAVLTLAAIPAAGGQLAAVPTSLPSYKVPNAPGSIRTPSLTRAPDRPEVRSYEQLVTLWKQAGQGYGVPWQVLGAINKIESNYGQNMGPSSAGAAGWMQFMPSTWMRWGIDADGDGLANPWDPEDAVFSAARYLAAAGAHEDIDRAIFAYNHAQWYVEEVLALAGTLGDAPFTPGPSTALTVAPGPDFGARIDRARERVEQLSNALDHALGRVDGRAWQRLQLERRLGNPNLSNQEFARLDGRLTRLGQAERSSQGTIDRLRTRFAAAVEALKKVKAAQKAAAQGTGLAGGGYVFPVAGEASFSDSFRLPRTTTWHHGIDIFAAKGTPIVAVTDGTLFNVGWNDVGGNRLWLRDSAGNEYYYAHLSDYAPLARDGAVIHAGDVIGYVGDTGDAAGTPSHLHFEIHPPELRAMGYDGVINPYPYLVAWQAGGVTGGQQSFDGWVFPVGGGVANVSTAHTHHDYPAADIAAPLGAPLYALHDAVVTQTFTTDSGKCGIGLILRATTGEEFLYCHLSSLESHIVAGRALRAGELVGRVGATGNATGPHLHLSFMPATHYPQTRPWFQAFAGIAFRWQDGPTPERSEAVAAKGLRKPDAPGLRIVKVIRKRVIHFTTTG
jgi:murein DD-endopeptidase MepM/ murein hydrolase activator NlpD